MVTCSGTMDEYYPSAVWNQWVCNSSSTTASHTISGDIWTKWATTATITTTTNCTAGDYIWYTWVGSDDYKVKNEQIPIEYVYGKWAEAQFEKVEQRRARLAQEEIHRIEAEERRKEQERLYKELQDKKDKAEAKAQELLLDLIGEKKLQIYKETGRVFVHGQKYDYVIKKAGGVLKLNKNKVEDLCIHINNRDRYKVPQTDNVIALKLQIEANEKEFNKIANNHGVLNYDGDQIRRRLLAV